MGQAIAAAVEQDSRFAIDRDHGDVLVDFSAPAALEASLDRAVSAGIPILIGTTGLDEIDQPRIAEAAEAHRRAARGEHVARRGAARRPGRARRAACSGPTGTSRSSRSITG